MDKDIADQLFNATPEELGETAVKHVLKEAWLAQEQKCFYCKLPLDITKESDLGEGKHPFVERSSNGIRIVCYFCNGPFSYEDLCKEDIE